MKVEKDRIMNYTATLLDDIRGVEGKLDSLRHGLSVHSLYDLDLTPELDAVHGFEATLARMRQRIRGFHAEATSAFRVELESEVESAVESNGHYL